MPHRGQRNNNKASKKNQLRKTNNNNRPRVSGRGKEDPEIRHNERIVRPAEQQATDSIQEALREISTTIEGISLNDNNTLEALYLIFRELRRVQEQTQEVQRRHFFQTAIVATTGAITALIIVIIVTTILH